MANNVLEQKVREAIEEAHTACQTSGSSSSDCAVAWDIVEELQAAVAHSRGLADHQTAFEQYCNEHPDASECRIYEL